MNPSSRSASKCAKIKSKLYTRDQAVPCRDEYGAVSFMAELLENDLLGSVVALAMRKQNVT
jgi:hypothetical protein